ncbi:hypothetical protein LTR36_009795 [Oleoguttula mirabilis]|uniref:Uncharacterized protein n=1 Tax=Oleoguttula mirabilis TaxID=1507867 RepID=A0AAV9J564_9PEZI|nr:hypothetical protein LTR36_009795 [Oleoguttula mirabilis]
MRSFSTRYAALAASLVAAAKALDGIVVPGTVAAGTSFNATFLNGSSDKYRVYLAAALTGVNGPTCYLVNSTDLSSPVALNIPADAGPSADYYSIAVSDLTTSQGATYSNAFNLTGGTGNYTEYELHLGGAPFWDADDLPCSSYACARQCAEASYPADLTDASAYNTMKSCMLNCSGVLPAASQTAPAHATSTGETRENPTTLVAAAAMITLSSGGVLTAVETTVTSGGSTITEAIVGGSATLTLGGAEATISSEVLSLAKSGIVEVSGSTTVAFNSMTLTTSVTDSSAAASATSASAAATSSGAAGRQEMAIAGVAGVAGLAALLL